MLLKEMLLKDRVAQVLEKVFLSSEKSGRSGKDICILAASKKHPPPLIREAFHCGLCNFGENYIQEYHDKVKVLDDLKIIWHFIGPLQSNKVKSIVGTFAMIQSVGRLKILHEIHRQSMKKNLVQKILLQVNFSKEKSKSGFFEEEIPSVLEAAQSCRGLQVCGLMVMPPPVNHEECNRAIFARAKSESELWKKYLNHEHHLGELSMGTSQDFSIAIEEGATMVRLGSLLLGPRKIS